MPMNLSEQSIDALAEVISGGSANDQAPVIGLYRQGWKIEQFMRAVGVQVSIAGKSRVSMTKEGVIDAMNRQDGAETIRRMIERATDPRDFIDDPERLANVINYLNSRLAFDGYRVERDGNRSRLVAVGTTATVVGAFSSAVAAIDFDTVQRDLDRALASVEADPEDAVTAACSIVESVCRSILMELESGLPAKKDIQSLYQAVREPLGLSPGRGGVPDHIADDVRAILGGLNTVVSGIGALRTHAGDAHGRERGYRRIDARIARLAIHSASAAALFLVETWRQKFPSRPLPSA